MRAGFFLPHGKGGSTAHFLRAPFRIMASCSASETIHGCFTSGTGEKSSALQKFRQPSGGLLPCWHVRPHASRAAAIAGGMTAPGTFHRVGASRHDRSTLKADEDDEFQRRSVTSPTLPVGMAAAPGLATVVDGMPMVIGLRQAPASACPFGDRPSWVSPSVCLLAFSFFFYFNVQSMEVVRPTPACASPKRSP
jgi:hypothetical protein